MIKSLLKTIHPRFQNLFLEYKVEFKPRYGHGLPAHAGLKTIIEKGRSDYAAFLQKALTYSAQIQNIKNGSAETDASKPRWNNGFLPGLDIVALYSMVANYAPSKYVEVGSGNSTKVAHQAKADLALSTQIISIDPMPRAEIDHLADKIIREPFENIDLKFIDELGENDILFIDNSHRILPNSDAMVFFMEVLPRLKKGVIVHIHDIYLPYDYPQFMCDRFYNEQYGLAMFLMANPDKYKTLLPNYFISEDKALAEVISPMWNHANLEGVERHGGSYWLQINS